MRTLHGPAEIARYFETESPPIFYVSKTPYNALGLADWIPNLSYISEGSFFDRPEPACFAPPLAGPSPTFEATNDAILTHPETARFVASKGPHGRALFLMFDESNERAARRLGLDVAFPPARLRARLDDKLTTTRIGNEVGIRSVPNVLAKVDSYAALRSAASHLGEDLVIQLPMGDSGQTTFFVCDEASYSRHASSIETATEVKIMRRIACRQAAIEACVTRHGVVVAPLATELVGFPELTPYRGGWCGNEIAAGAFPQEIVERATDMARRFGAALAARGYRGYFGLDFLIDESTGEVFLGELNPRVTGVAPLTTQIAKEQGNLPLFLLHLLEWLDVEYTIDVADLNARWARIAPARGWSQLIVKCVDARHHRLERAPSTGRYRMQDGGTIAHVSHEVSLSAVEGGDEAWILRTLERGWSYGNGDCLARLLTPARVMSPEYRLEPRARSWIEAVRRELETT